MSFYIFIHKSVTDKTHKCYCILQNNIYLIATKMTSEPIPENKYILPTNELVKKIISLSAATSGVIGANYPRLLFPATYYINAYVFLDLFFAKMDMFIHHLLVLSFFVAINVHQYPDDYKLNFMNQVIKFEYSTILYNGGPIVLHYLSKQKHPTIDIQKWVPRIRTIFHIGFAVLFIKYRIYDFSTKIVFNENIYALYHFQNGFAFMHLILTTWAFHSLNIYWMQLILWKIIPNKIK